jgi:excisionase family DNA binding protein
MGKELSVVEATRRLGVSLDAIYKLIYAGKLPAHKTDGRWRIPGAAVDERLRAQAARRAKTCMSSSAAPEAR